MHIYYDKAKAIVTLAKELWVIGSHVISNQ